ncbi:YlmG-like protein 2, chloroplastic [Porphyridium purpureum]|uniref:YlmG-like protein 2, chloroplastic n=1 Tax=Porphyridium purpureum TaxID=35688 RepID=A0A5J4YHW0_PORPP|nr:YlmG-like protein 2, chloroplastic [Porphyridium purpureum]|eukprot:POR1769..scf226_27
MKGMITMSAADKRRVHSCASALIPGNSTGEMVVVGGLANFFSLYGNLVTARILLSWFPGIQGNPIVRPVIQVCDPFLNAFRGIIPPIGGIDLSPVLALITLQVLGNATTTLGAELPPARGASRSPRGIRFDLNQMAMNVRQRMMVRNSRKW